jgi:hypothetical protein
VEVVIHPCQGTGFGHGLDTESSILKFFMPFKYNNSPELSGGLFGRANGNNVHLRIDTAIKVPIFIGGHDYGQDGSQAGRWE